MSLRKLCLPAAVAVLAVLFVQPGASSGVREGGIFRVTFQAGLGSFDHIDPALAYSRESWTLLDTTCARLMRYPDKPPPAGYRIVPEVATGFPKVSADGKTHTFTLRKGFRFSDGRPVQADAFAQAISRTLAPGVMSPALRYTRAIVGAEDVRAGRTPRPSGVTARGRTLVVRFTQEVRDFAAWTTMPFFCAVPPTLPPSAEGVRGFPEPAPITSRNTAPTSASSSGATASTAARAHTTSTASTSISAPTRPSRCSTGPSPARRTGGTPWPDPTSARHELPAEVRAQQEAVLPQPGPHAGDVRPQLVTSPVPRQPEAAAGGQLRPRPDLADTYRPPGAGRISTSRSSCRAT